MIAAQILQVRAGLHAAVAALEHGLEYGNDVLLVADAAAIVAEHVTELKRLLALVEHGDAMRAPVRRRPSRARPSSAPAA